METHTLRDGTRVGIRPIGPEDKDGLREGLARLSERSRFFRFLSGTSRLSEGQLRYLTEIDHRDHEALGAVLADDEGERLGVARYVLCGDGVAEAAVVVLDAYQGRGLGTLLLGRLAARARTAGIRAFRGYVHPDNRAMLALFEDLGASVRPDPETGLLLADLSLGQDDVSLRDTPAARVFRAAARGELA